MKDTRVGIEGAELVEACLNFIHVETPKARSSDVVFEEGGLTSEANLTLIQLGVENDLGRHCLQIDRHAFHEAFAVRLYPLMKKLTKATKSNVKSMR